MHAENAINRTARPSARKRSRSEEERTGGIGAVASGHVLWTLSELIPIGIMPFSLEKTMEMQGITKGFRSQSIPTKSIIRTLQETSNFRKGALAESYMLSGRSLCQMKICGQQQMRGQ